MNKLEICLDIFSGLHIIEKSIAVVDGDLLLSYFLHTKLTFLQLYSLINSSVEQLTSTEKY